MRTLGAQNINGRSQNETDGFRAEVSHVLRTGRKWVSGLHCDWRWNMGFSPHSWIQATVTAMAPYAFPQNQKLAGLWIGAAISSTSHSKSVLPLSFEHDSQVKDQGRRQCCHNKHKQFPYRPTHDVYLLSWYASHNDTFRDLDRNNPAAI